MADSGPALGQCLDSAEAVQSFAATLVPLLLEVWVEASTSDCFQNSSEGTHLLTPDAMSVMFQVLSILQLLRKLAPTLGHRDALVRLSLTSFHVVDSFSFKVNHLFNYSFSQGCVVS